MLIRYDGDDDDTNNIWYYRFYIWEQSTIYHIWRATQAKQKTTLNLDCGEPKVKSIVQDNADKLSSPLSGAKAIQKQAEKELGGKWQVGTILVNENLWSYNAKFKNMNWKTVSECFWRFNVKRFFVFSLLIDLPSYYNILQSVHFYKPSSLFFAKWLVKLLNKN